MTKAYLESPIIIIIIIIIIIKTSAFPFENCRPSCCELEISESLFCSLLIPKVASVLSPAALLRLMVSSRDIYIFKGKSVLFKKLLD